MKITLVADVSANGKLLLTDNPNHPVPESTIEFYIGKVNQAGNLIIGRKTAQMFEQHFGGLKSLFPEAEVLVLSTADYHDTTVKVMPGHQEAINYLQQKGIDEVVVGGGTAVYNHFINKNLVTDIYFNYVPVLIGDGGVLGTAIDLLTNFRVAEHCLLEGDILQMHYSRQE